MFGCSFGPFFGWHGWWGVLAFVLVTILALFVVFRNGAKRRSSDGADSLAILKRRLAAGEITIEEFTTLKQYL